jgi:hypothetical protein
MGGVFAAVIAGEGTELWSLSGRGRTRDHGRGKSLGPPGKRSNKRLGVKAMDHLAWE